MKLSLPDDPAYSLSYADFERCMSVYLSCPRDGWACARRARVSLDEWAHFKAWIAAQDRAIMDAGRLLMLHPDERTTVTLASRINVQERNVQERRASVERRRGSAAPETQHSRNRERR